MTCVKFLFNGDRFLTSSLDQSLKIYKTDSFEVTHQYKFNAPITTFDVTKDQ